MASISQRQILSSLRQSNRNLQAIARTVYNAKAKIIRESLSGRTIIEALFEELGKGGFTFDIERDVKGHLTNVFFAHPYSIALTKSYPNVCVMDCTYKTNKYKMPLLDIVGVSSFNSIFYSCFAFMQKEEECDYVWALEKFRKILGDEICPLVIVTDRKLALMKAIEVVFPRTRNLLCVWHIEKNILAKCKSHFNEKEDWEKFLCSWTSLIQCYDESLFEETWKDFEVKYKDKEYVLKYIKSTWLPFKERFVDAWTEKYTHFGTRVTSRVEGAHATLKRYLQVSTGDFREVKEKICLAIENQFQEIKAKLSSEKVRIPHKFRIPLFEELLTHVSIFALKMLYKQYELVIRDEPLDECKGHFLSSMGLPCAHKLRDKKDGKLHLFDIHRQWRIDMRSFSRIGDELTSEGDKFGGILKEFYDKYQQLPLGQKEDAQRKISQFVDASTPLIMDPTIQPHKGRSIGKKRKESSSTSRDPSLFEIVEKTRKCSVCQKSGHNSHTCSQQLGGFGLLHKDENASIMEVVDLNMPFDSSTTFQCL